jgi:hypothetical protein
VNGQVVDPAQHRWVTLIEAGEVQAGRGSSGVPSKSRCASLQCRVLRTGGHKHAWRREWQDVAAKFKSVAICQSRKRHKSQESGGVQNSPQTPEAARYPPGEVVGPPRALLGSRRDPGKPTADRSVPAELRCPHDPPPDWHDRARCGRSPDGRTTSRKQSENVAARKRQRRGNVRIRRAAGRTAAGQG